MTRASRVQGVIIHAIDFNGCLYLSLNHGFQLTLLCSSLDGVMVDIHNPVMQCGKTNNYKALERVSGCVYGYLKWGWKVNGPSILPSFAIQNYIGITILLKCILFHNYAVAQAVCTFVQPREDHGTTVNALATITHRPNPQSSHPSVLHDPLMETYS